MKKTWMRAGVALTAAAALGVGLAGTAHADDEKEPVKATPTTESGWKVNGGDGSSVGQISASRIYLTTADGTKSPVYCIDIHTRLDTTHEYEEGSWEESGVANLPLVQWILHNSYPNVAPADLAEAAGADVAGLDEKTLEQAAYTATQTAIWNKTDGFKLDAADSTAEGAEIDALVTAIDKYLVESAEEMPEPTKEFTLDGPDAWDASEKSDAFKLTAPGGTAKVKAEGAKIVDENDKELSEVKSGQEFYLIPDDGAEKITLTATSEYSTPSGSVFLTTGQPVEAAKELKTDKSQRLILAKALPGETGAEWEFELDDSGTLPVTGMSLTNSLLAGAGLLLVGALAVVVMRRRRVASSWGDA
ncbi:thioester domain-containing protein [Stackebrandtia nassauensis]|uniref:LPXTG-motif cell wall anchor domain protein n=1 Tax=Stackebrandtia nassauensis (strain DSM 44728 / CIP 108903 / NRRL B-16338 / NBRC 102104 / LLR-40K-21) TaxID=446470 RepID=D3Q1D0_STANL|nr:thioester domain-containing protein [Stackebrandtia nassauensis]ADD45710.1 LPXTG-motif cell wall anchor domain protein [Stackebrandtia nassauensis DSM 44728]